MFDCEYCGKQFSRGDNRNRHMLSSCKGKRIRFSDNNTDLQKCEICDVYVEKNCYTAHIRSATHRSKAFVIVDDGVKRSISTFGGRIVSYQISDSSQIYVDIEEFSNNVREKVLTLIESTLYVHNSIKMNLELYGLYYLLTKENVEIKSFNTMNKIITQGSDLYGLYNDYIDEIKTKMSEFQERNSGKIK